MVDAQTVGVLVTAASVTVAAIYYIFTLRINMRTQELALKAQQQTLEARQADILQRQAQIYTTQDFMDAWHDVTMNQRYLTFEEWLQHYGPYGDPDAYTHHMALIQYYECLGGLLRQNLVSMELLERIWQPLHLICVWDRVEPVIKGWRSVYKDDSICNNFEFLFNRYMERHPVSALSRSVRHEEMVRHHDE